MKEGVHLDGGRVVSESVASRGELGFEVGESIEVLVGEAFAGERP